MITPKNIAMAGMILSASCVSSVVMAQPTLPGQIALYQGSPSSVDYSYSVGGEFTALTDPTLFSSYASSTLATVTINNTAYTGFQTFCVQTGVDFTPGTVYNYSTSLASIGSPDAFSLSEGTAWLYSQFAQGILGGYDYTDPATRTTDAGALQAAIWELQGGQTYSGYPNGESGNLYYDEAMTALGANLDTAATLSTDFGVEILNISTIGVGADQNQLIYTGSGGGTTHQNVPDTGSTSALLAVGVVGMGIFSLKSRPSLV
ncbi:MAG TPA: hypothetical protein VH595_10515 [Verrucomicrobiae bacterium]|nr:hypothetical protein [Verrucomicrobiae bacterium]